MKLFHVFSPHKIQKAAEFCRVAAMILAIFSVFACLTLMKIFFDSKQLQASNIFCYLFLVFFRTFFATQFMFASAAVQNRFKILNVHLTQETFIKQEKNFLVSKYSTVYHSLCDGIDMINETFTLQLVFTFAVIMVWKHFHIILGYD